VTVNFPLILACLTLFTGMVVLIDSILMSYRRRRGRAARSKKLPLTIEYARAFFPLLLIVFLVRSFFIQPYRVPTGSLEPTLQPGDFIIVNQYQYGLRMPVFHNTFWSFPVKNRGEVALFYYPVNERYTFLKRIVGLPGDVISYVNKQLYINHRPVPLVFQRETTAHAPEGAVYRVAIYEENLDGIKHQVYIRPDVNAVDFYELKVPPGEYFMMGDNRDNSDDSRFWGFVPADNLIGKAMVIWMSWDATAPAMFDKVRWKRIGQRL